MRGMEKLDFRKLTGVKPIMELPLGRDALAVRHSPNAIASLRPLLAVTDDPKSTAAHAAADSAFASGHSVAVFVLRRDDGTAATCARRAEDVLDAARRLAHANAGKTVEVWAEGTAIEPAAWMFFLERFYFSTFTAVGDCADRPGFPSWKELVK